MSTAVRPLAVVSIWRESTQAHTAKLAPVMQLQRLGWSSIERRRGPVIWFHVQEGAHPKPASSHSGSWARLEGIFYAENKDLLMQLRCITCGELRESVWSAGHSLGFVLAVAGLLGAKRYVSLHTQES